MTRPEDIPDIIAAAESVHEKIIQDGPESSIHHIAKALKAERDGQWQTMDTVPKGANGISWMLLSYGPEADQTVGIGMRFNDKFFAASTFYIDGPPDGRQFEFREHEVTPTHWRPLPPPPTDKQEG